MTKYLVETMYAHSNEWSNEIEEYADAVEYASFMSRLAGVSETRIWYGDELDSTWVDGEIVRPVDWEEEPIEDAVDEMGFNPYMGCYDWDC